LHEYSILSDTKTLRDLAPAASFRPHRLQCPYALWTPCQRHALPYSFIHASDVTAAAFLLFLEKMGERDIQYMLGADHEHVARHANIARRALIASMAIDIEDRRGKAQC